MTPKPDAKVYKADDGLWHWRLRLPTGEIIPSPTGHTQRVLAQRELAASLEAAADVLNVLDELHAHEADRLSG